MSNFELSEPERPDRFSAEVIVEMQHDSSGKVLKIGEEFFDYLGHEESETLSFTELVDYCAGIGDHTINAMTPHDSDEESTTVEECYRRISPPCGVEGWGFCVDGIELPIKRDEQSVEIEKVGDSDRAYSGEKREVYQGRKKRGTFQTDYLNKKFLDFMYEYLRGSGDFWRNIIEPERWSTKGYRLVTDTPIEIDYDCVSLWWLCENWIINSGGPYYHKGEEISQAPEWADDSGNGITLDVVPDHLFAINVEIPKKVAKAWQEYVRWTEYPRVELQSKIIDFDRDMFVCYINVEEHVYAHIDGKGGMLNLEVLETDKVAFYELEGELV